VLFIIIFRTLSFPIITPSSNCQGQGQSEGQDIWVEVKARVQIRSKWRSRSSSRSRSKPRTKTRSQCQCRSPDPAKLSQGQVKVRVHPHLSVESRGRDPSSDPSPYLILDQRTPVLRVRPDLGSGVRGFQPRCMALCLQQQSIFSTWTRSA